MSRRPRTLVAAVLIAVSVPLVIAPSASAASVGGATTMSIKGPGRCC
jgi:hypothetical protein